MSYLVNVCNGICGQGKTSAAINMINDSSNEEKFIYVTPYLTEIDRVIEACPKKRFKQPEKKDGSTKMRDLKKLLYQGVNIATSHSLFGYFNEDIIDITKLNNYTLILDEVAEVVRPLEISDKDLNTIIVTEKYAHVDENTGMLIWTDKEYTGEFEKYKRLCELNCVSVYGEGKDKKVFLWMFPVSIFRAFKSIYILTYMFDAQIQKYYYDFYNVKYKYIYVKNDNIDGNTDTSKFHFTEEPQTYNVTIYKDLIDICMKDTLNDIGEPQFSLSKGWYKDNSSEESKIGLLKKRIYNYFHNIAKTKGNKNLWTTFEKFEGRLSDKGYKKSFIPLNLRATNLYRDRVSIAYTVNYYMNPLIKNFFVAHGIDVNEDKFALSELIQFLFRSAVRDKKEISLYIPSKRMRNLLIRWLDGEFD